MEKGRNNRGLASADESTRKRVSSQGGKPVSQNRQHMSEIGRKGGHSSRRNK